MSPASLDFSPDSLPLLIPHLLLGRLSLGEEGMTQAGAQLARVCQGVSREDWESMIPAFMELGAEYRAYDAHPVARVLSREFLDLLLEEGSRVEGVEFIREAGERAGAGEAVVAVGNHLAYVDTTATWALMEKAGLGDVGDRITAAAGPKVYDDTFRRLATLGLHTLKVPQSSRLSHNQAGLTPAEVGRLAVQSLRQARALVGTGRILLLYPEGARSRTHRLGPFLSPTARYLDSPGTQVLPLALMGTDQIQPMEDEKMRRAKVLLRAGPLVDVNLLKAGGASREDVLAQVHGRLASLLSEEYQPAAGEPALV